MKKLQIDLFAVIRFTSVCNYNHFLHTPLAEKVNERMGEQHVLSGKGEE